jgi:hypothetical protein
MFSGLVSYPRENKLNARPCIQRGGAEAGRSRRAAPKRVLRAISATPRLRVETEPTDHDIFARPLTGASQWFRPGAIKLP